MDNASLDEKKRAKRYSSFSNEIARNAIITLTTEQYNILLFLISRIKRDDEPDRWYKVPFQELCEAINLKVDNGGAYYARIRADFIRLMEKCWCKAGEGEYPFSWLGNADATDQAHVDDNGKMTTTGKFEMDMTAKTGKGNGNNSRWSGMIHYQFNPYVASYLFHLTGNYTMVELSQIQTMVRPRSIRLYILLKSYVFKEKLENNEPTFIKRDLEELTNLMYYGKNLKEGNTTKFFIRDVIKPCVDEINKKTSEYHVDYVFENTGYEKRYTTIKFIITKAGLAQIESARKYQEMAKRGGSAE